MRDAHRRIGFVDVLAASTRCAKSVNAQLRWIDHHIDQFVGFRHYRDSARGSVYAPLRFGRRHALHAVPAGFKFEFGIGALAFNPGDDFAEATEIRIALGNDFNPPALALGITRVHTK